MTDPKEPGWKRNGRNGPLDWWLGCRDHGYDYQRGCMSCSMAEDHNIEFQQKLDRERAGTAGVMASQPMQPTPYGLAGIEGDAIVIRLTADACTFAFANDPQAREPRPPVINKQQFLRDTLNELTAEREDGSTPLTDMLDRAMVKAMENGSDALNHDAAGVAIPQTPADSRHENDTDNWW